MNYIDMYLLATSNSRLITMMNCDLKIRLNSNKYPSLPITYTWNERDVQQSTFILLTMGVHCETRITVGILARTDVCYPTIFYMPGFFCVGTRGYGVPGNENDESIVCMSVLFVCQYCTSMIN